MSEQPADSLSDHTIQYETQGDTTSKTENWMRRWRRLSKTPRPIKRKRGTK
jgi:hypothetical protein